MKRLRRLFRRHRRTRRIALLDLPLEILERILSFTATPTLAAVCRSSFALLQLASPLLYREICIPLIRLHELFCSRSLPSASPRILPYLALERIETLEIQDLRETPASRQHQTFEFPDRFLKPSSPLPIPRLLLTHRPFPSRYYKPGRGSITFPLIPPSTLIVQQNLSHSRSGFPREIAVNDPIALPLDRLQKVVFVGCIADVTAIPEWHECSMSGLRALGSVEDLGVVVDLTTLERVDREVTEEALCGMVGWRDDLTRLGERVEVWMRDEEEKTAMERMLRRLGLGERLNEGKLSVKVVEASPVWGLASWSFGLVDYKGYQI